MWIVEITDLFAEWLKEQGRAMQLDVLAVLNLLKQEGPHLGRPHVDTLYGSKNPEHERTEGAEQRAARKRVLCV